MRLELVSPQGWSGALKWTLGGPRPCPAPPEVRFKYPDPNFQSLSLMRRFAQGYKIIRGGTGDKRGKGVVNTTLATFYYCLRAMTSQLWASLEQSATPPAPPAPRAPVPMVNLMEWLHSPPVSCLSLDKLQRSGCSREWPVAGASLDCRDIAKGVSESRQHRFLHSMGKTELFVSVELGRLITLASRVLNGILYLLSVPSLPKSRLTLKGAGQRLGLQLKRLRRFYHNSVITLVNYMHALSQSCWQQGKWRMWIISFWLLVFFPPTDKMMGIGSCSRAHKVRSFPPLRYDLLHLMHFDHFFRGGRGFSIQK